MSGPQTGATSHDAESGKPLVGDDDNAADFGSVLRGPVATSMSAAGIALEGLRRLLRAVRGASQQHAGFELVRSADGDRKHGDPDDERDATGAVHHHAVCVMLAWKLSGASVTASRGQLELPCREPRCVSDDLVPMALVTACPAACLTAT